jgi:hypothetical protein
MNLLSLQVNSFRLQSQYKLSWGERGLQKETANFLAQNCMLRRAKGKLTVEICTTSGVTDINMFRY